MKRKRIFSVICFVLSLVLVFSVTGCADNKDTSKINPSDIDVWAAPNTQKIFQDSDYAEESRSPAEINLSAFKNESESAQLVLRLRWIFLPMTWSFLTSNPEATC